MLFFSRHGWISAISPCLGRGLPTTAVCSVNQVKTAAYVPFALQRLPVYRGYSTISVEKVYQAFIARRDEPEEGR